MARPVLLQDDFSLGASQDIPRQQLPRGKSYAVTDFLPAEPTSGGVASPLVSRSGWARPFNALAAGTYVAAVGVAPYSAGTRILAVNDSGTLYRLTPGIASVTSVGAAVVPAHSPTFYREYAYLFHSGGTSSPYRYDGTTLAVVGGSPPTASVSCVYKDHLVAARSNANKERIWFASAGNPTSWDTAADGQWLDASAPVQGLASFRNMILVFEEAGIERIRGDIIPGVVGSDMVKEPLFSIGTADPASIAVANEYVVFANQHGIYMTDGISLVELTEQAGIRQMWLYAMSLYSSSYTIAASLYSDWYIISVMSGSSSIISGMMHVRKRAWVSLSNVNATMIATAPRGIIDLYSSMWMAPRGSLFVTDLSAMFAGGSGTPGLDGDATPIRPSVETPYFIGRPGKKRWKDVYVTYKLTGSAAPTLTVAYQVDRTNVSSYTTAGTLASNSATTRVRVPVRKAAEGISLKISSNGTAWSSNIFALEADVWSMEGSR